MKEDKKKDTFTKKDILTKALDCGIDFKIKDNKGKEPIYYAILNKDNVIWNILLKKYNINASFSEILKNKSQM